MAWRNLLRYKRSPDLLAASTIQPVMFVLLFVYVFGGAINTGNISYVDFLIPGILVQTVLFGSTQTGIGLANDLGKGMVDRYRSLPIARSAVISGRIVADLLHNLLVIAIMLAVGSLVGFRFHGGVGGAILVPFVALSLGFAFSWISALIGVSVKSVEAAQTFGFLYVFPITFLSSLFVPIETMPDWLQAIARVNPMTVTVDAARALAQGGPVFKPLWQSLAWSAGILIVVVPLAVRRYRRSGG